MYKCNKIYICIYKCCVNFSLKIFIRSKNEISWNRSMSDKGVKYEYSVKFIN